MPISHWKNGGKIEMLAQIILWILFIAQIISWTFVTTQLGEERKPYGLTNFIEQFILIFVFAYLLFWSGLF